MKSPRRISGDKPRLQRLAQSACGWGVFMSGGWIFIFVFLMVDFSDSDMISVGSVWAEEGQKLIVEDGSLRTLEPHGPLAITGPAVGTIHNILAVLFFITALLGWLALRSQHTKTSPMQADDSSGQR